MKDLSHFRCFLGIEVAHSPQGISLSQWKYHSDLLTESDMLGSRPIDISMNLVVRFDQNLSDALEDPGK